MRSRWAPALAAAVLMVLGGAAAATATEPPSLGESRVLDVVDVLTPAQERQVQDRAEELSAGSGVDLWVVFVDEFTAPSAPADWANETASANGLGAHQYLLAVATEGRTYYLSADDTGPVGADAVVRIERELVQPELAADDWAGAALAAADGLEGAVGGSGSSGSSGSSASSASSICFSWAASGKNLSLGTSRTGLRLASLTNEARATSPTSSMSMRTSLRG